VHTLQAACNIACQYARHFSRSCLHYACVGAMISLCNFSKVPHCLEQSKCSYQMMITITSVRQHRRSEAFSCTLQRHYSLTACLRSTLSNNTYTNNRGVSKHTSTDIPYRCTKALVPNRYSNISSYYTVLGSQVLS
jgi:hypothetical protein